MKTRAVKRIAGKAGKDPEKVPPTIPLAANYMQVIRQQEQIPNFTCTCINWSVHVHQPGISKANRMTEEEGERDGRREGGDVQG